MPFEFNWQDTEHTIMRVDVLGDPTWDEFTKVTDQIVEALAKANHRLDLVYNSKVPMPKGNPMPHIKAANLRMAVYKGHLGLVITVGSRNISSVIKVMVDIMMRVYKMDRSHLGETVTTMDEALSQISRSRAKEKAARTAT